jgi:hypothetical protein
MTSNLDSQHTPMTPAGSSQAEPAAVPPRHQPKPEDCSTTMDEQPDGGSECGGGGTKADKDF